MRGAQKSTSTLPGDPPKGAEIERMIRVDQAGEFGAVQIYRGQLAVLGETKSAAVIEEMLLVERGHLAAFNRIMTERGVRPTALGPLWRAGGFLLGAATALLGERHAMACTVAVEEVIDGHYRRQAARLEGAGEAALKQTVEDFGAEEAAHLETARHHEAEAAPGYRPLSAAIRRGTRLAIWLSERI